MSPAGYSGTSLPTKLGIVEGGRVCLIGAPDDYRALLGPLPHDVEFGSRVTAATSIVHLFCDRRADLARRLEALRTRIAPDAAVWVSWPKKASRVPTDITEDSIREVSLPLGFVDVKVCAVSEVWSGLKLMIRKELRPVRSTRRRSG